MYDSEHGYATAGTATVGGRGEFLSLSFSFEYYLNITSFSSYFSAPHNVYKEGVELMTAELKVEKD